MSVDGLAAYLGGHPNVALVVTVLAGFVVWSAGVEAASSLAWKLRGLPSEDDRREARDILGVLVLVSTGTVSRRYDGDDIVDPEVVYHCASVRADVDKLHEETLWYLASVGLIEAADDPWLDGQVARIVLTDDGHRLLTTYGSEGLEGVHRALTARRREQRAQSKALTTATIEES